MGLNPNMNNVTFFIFFLLKASLMSDIRNFYRHFLQSAQSDMNFMLRHYFSNFQVITSLYLSLMTRPVNTYYDICFIPEVSLKI